MNGRSGCDAAGRYSKVRNHPTVATIYADQLKSEQTITDERAERYGRAQPAGALQAGYDAMKANEGKAHVHVSQETGVIVPEDAGTAVPMETLKEINLELLNRPEGFTEYTKLQRILQRRATSLNDGEKLDWAHAETLAFATILADGTRFASADRIRSAERSRIATSC